MKFNAIMTSFLESILTQEQGNCKLIAHKPIVLSVFRLRLAFVSSFPLLASSTQGFSRFFSVSSLALFLLFMGAAETVVSVSTTAKPEDKSGAGMVGLLV